MITIRYISGSGINNGVFDAGESKKEAIDKGLRFYIGKLCEYGHYAQTETGEKINGSLRRADSGNCRMCHSRLAANRRYKLDRDPYSHEARKRIEDIKLARELGISVDDL